LRLEYSPRLERGEPTRASSRVSKSLVSLTYEQVNFNVMYQEEDQGVNEEEIEAQISYEAEESIPQGRPKRSHLRPKWLNGYVTALSPKGIMKSPNRGVH
jgi:hypothetical protein